MAYRRSALTFRSKLFHQTHKPSPAFSHFNHNDQEETHIPTNPISQNTPKVPTFFHQRFFGTINNHSTFNGSRNLFRDTGFLPGPGCLGYGARNFSTSGSVGEGKIEILNGVVDALGDKAAEVAGQVGPVVSEVTIAAADSFFPVAALQYAIDYIHMSTGMGWWASIALTTLLIRTLQLPLIINQLKATSKFTLLRPKLEAIKEEMQNRDMSPNAVTEGQAEMKKLFKEYGVTPFTPLKGLLISGPIFCSFFFAVRNMAEKVPSFKEGGIFWFTDLTTPDAMYIFPVLTALSFWITVELNAQEGLEGNPTGNTIKNVSRGFAALSIPLTASFPKAIFCYWITSNLFSLTYGLVIKKPEVKKLLGIPIITPPPPSSADQKPGFSFFDALKKYAAAQQQKPLSSPEQKSLLSSVEDSSSKPTTQKIASSSVLNQRIKSLEKEVKGRKKGGKKRR